jgi:hypothetical protein
MDIVYLSLAGLFWGAMALMVAGLRKLQRPQGSRS